MMDEVNTLKQQGVVHGPVHPVKICVVQKEHPHERKKVIYGAILVNIPIHVVVIAAYVKGEYNGDGGYNNGNEGV
jgi:hypothetical protein